MTEIVKITEKDGKIAVSARDLYRTLTEDVRFRHFNEWTKRNILENEFATEGIDYKGMEVFDNQSSPTNGGNPVGGRPSENYILTLDFAKELCMLSKCKNGKQVRLYFIEVEKAYQKQQNNLVLPEDYASALRQLADTWERERKLSAQVKQLEFRQELNQPKVEFADAICNTVDNISIDEFAKALSNDNYNIGEKRLFRWLRESGYLMSNNIPYQKYIDLGYFYVKEGYRPSSDGFKSYFQSRITGKGQLYFADKLKCFKYYE